jgi:hypothetical protein
MKLTQAVKAFIHLWYMKHKKTKSVAVEVVNGSQKPEVEKFLHQVVKSFGYEMALTKFASKA